MLSNYIQCPVKFSQQPTLVSYRPVQSTPEVTLMMLTRSAVLLFICLSLPLIFILLKLVASRELNTTLLARLEEIQVRNTEIWDEVC